MGKGARNETDDWSFKKHDGMYAKFVRSNLYACTHVYIYMSIDARETSITLVYPRFVTSNLKQKHVVPSNGRSKYNVTPPIRKRVVFFLYTRRTNE